MTYYENKLQKIYDTINISNIMIKNLMELKPQNINP